MMQYLGEKFFKKIGVLAPKAETPIFIKKIYEKLGCNLLLSLFCVVLDIVGDALNQSANGLDR